MKATMLLLALFFSTIVFSQCNLTISGQVIDIHDNSIVEQAKISLKGYNSGAYSDSLGRYSIPNLCPGSYQIIVSHHLGCKPLRFEFNLKQDTVLNLNIEFHLLELHDVNADAYVLDRSVSSETELSVRSQTLNAGKTLGDMLGEIPGISTFNTGVSISKPIIRGMHSNRLILLNNGVRQEGQQWGGEHAPEVDGLLNESLSVVKGASAVRYGPEAFGGVVKVSPGDWGDQNWSGKSSVGAVSNGRMYFGSTRLENNSIRFKGLHFRAGVSYKKSGDQNTPTYILSNTGYEEFNYFGQIGYQKGKHSFDAFHSQFTTTLGILAASHLGNLTDLKQAISNETPLIIDPFTYDIKAPSQQIEHSISKLAYAYIRNPKQQIELDYSFQFNNRLEIDEGQDNSQSPDFQLNLSTHQLNVAAEQKFSKGVKIEIGMNGQYQENKGVGRFLIPNYVKQNVGAFLIYAKKWDYWALESGVRVDNFYLQSFYFEEKELVKPILTFSKPSANLGLSRLFGHHWIVRSNAAYSWRPPSISELYSNGLHHGAAAIEIGDKSLKEESVFSLQTSGEFKSNRLTAQVELYQYYFNNYIFLNPSNEFVLTIKGAFPEFRFKEIEAFYSGVESWVNFKWYKWLSQEVSHSLVRVIDLTNKAFVVGIAPDYLQNEFQFTPQLKKKNINTFLAISNSYRSKQNRVEENADYALPPDGVFLINIKSQTSFEKNGRTFVLSGSVENLLNTKYRSYLNRYRYFSDEIGRSFRLNFQIKF
ncbi:MAG: TonB-dependent receptor [Bacteroidetes bacterium]|nr:TonB-dependent receptor [Bacteroidota bacterium]